MKIRNSTRYSTRTLHAIFTATYRDLAKVEGVLPRWKHYVFEVVHSRGTRYSGCAAYNGTWARIRLPKVRARTADIARLVEHELLHSYGYHHKQMGGAHYPWGSAHADRSVIIERFGKWVGEAAPKEKTHRRGVELQEHRHRLVLAGIGRWEKKLKTAQTRLKNLRKKKRYYEHTLAAKRADRNAG